MELHLDRRYPVVWRSPTTIQIGVDGERVVLERITPQLEHLLGAVTAGISEDRLRRLGASVGVKQPDVDAFVARLRPVLGSAGPTMTPRPVCAVDGSGPFVDAVTHRMHAVGIQVVRPADGDARPSAAVVAGSFAIAPARYIRWLSRDIPHLSVVFGDTGASVGPFVEPGRGPCLHCVANEKVDKDESWPIVAAQLVDRSAAAEHEPLLGHIAARVAHVVEVRLRLGENELSSSSIRLEDASVAGRTVQHRRHPNCGCRSLSETVTVP